MKYSFLLLLWIFGYQSSYSQTTERYTIFTYTKPPGFVLRNRNEQLFLEKLENKQYCQLFIYPVTESTGSIDKDFEDYWNFFARNPSQQVNDPETKTYDSLNGWNVLYGTARGTYKKQMFVVTVSAFTKNKKKYMVASVFTDKKFTDAAQAFVSEVVPDEKMIIQNKSQINEISQTDAMNSGTVRSTGISTVYSDGWTSTYIGPHVTVTKENLLAWIFPVNDSLDKVGRKPDELIEDRYWRYAVNQFFQVKNVTERPWQMSGTGSDKIFEAEVKNRQTGEESFAAMRLIWNSGRVQIVLAFAPTKESMYKSVFTQYNSFEQVLSYNKFTVTPALLTGTWQSFETGTTGSYSIAGGFQGGNSKISFTDGFIFNADGTYESKHNVSRNNGTMRRTYEGRYHLNSSTLQLTNRDKEDPGEMECWMEAVHGGLALVMLNKKFTGQQYKLYKIK